MNLLNLKMLSLILVEVWTSLDDFHGHEFHVGVLPWSHHVMGDKVIAMIVAFSLHSC